MFESPFRTVSMVDPLSDAQLKGTTDRLRDLEDQFAARYGYRPNDGFEGVREYSRAWHENRTTAYLLRKSWADPTARTLFLIGMIIIACGWAYLWMQ